MSILTAPLPTDPAHLLWIVATIRADTQCVHSIAVGTRLGQSIRDSVVGIITVTRCWMSALSEVS